jgi:subtilisin family serine protease
MKNVLVLVLIMLGMIFAQAPKNESLDDMPKFFQGKIRVRLTEQAKSSKNLLVKERDVLYTKTGITSLDLKNEQVKASSIKIDIIEAKNKVLAKKLGLDRWFSIEIPMDADVLEIVELYKSDPNVDIAQPQICYYLMATPNDPYFSNNWGHNNTVQLPQYNPDTSSHSGPGIGLAGFDTDIQSGWNGTQGYGSPDVVVCIMDTGIDYTHPDLAANYIGGYDFGMNDDDPIYDTGAEVQSIAPHGTNCAGVAAGIANNGIGVSGVAGNCSIMMVKVSTTGGVFNGVTNGTIWAADNGADVISMSFGSPTAYYGEDPVYDAAIDYAYAEGVTLLASTGNYGTSYTKISGPANHPKVIAVGAAAPEGVRKSETTSDIEGWWSSMYDVSAPQDDMNAVDILAPTIMPATDIQGSDGYASGDYFEFFNGTSSSCPYAAGFAALVKSKYPSYTPAQIRQLMVDTARDIAIGESSVGWDVYSGYGMIDIGEALGYVPTTPPGTPSLVTPLNSSTIPDPTPAFEWDDNPETASYTILIDNNSDFSSPEINETVVPSNYTPASNLLEGTYYWKVLATNVAGSSSYTATWSIDLIYADINLNPTSVYATAPPTATDDQIFSIQNTSIVQLDYSLSINYINGKEIKASGGPDTYGYKWEDSDEIGGPVYDWVEINSLGNSLNLGDEDESVSLNMGFTFNYYGVDYTSIVVGSNGTASFLEDDITYENTAIPTNGMRALLAVFWDDLNPDDSGQIYSYADTANDRFIIEWDGVADYLYGGGGNLNTFQAIIYRTGKIIYQYKSMGGILDECTVGIGDPTATDGSLVTYNTGYLKNNLRIEFMATPEWLSLNSSTGSVNGVGSDQITITCDATDLDLGTYTANIMVASNDPDESTKILPVTFDVAYGATGGTFLLDHSSLSYGGVGVGSSVIKTFEITNSHSTETMLGQITTIDGYVVYPNSKEEEKNVLDYTIAPSSSKTFDLSFEPTAQTTYNGNITITSSSIGHSTEYVAVTGTGTYPQFEIPFSEDFNASTELPVGWEIVDNQGSGQVWEFGTHANGISGAGGNYAYLFSDGFGSGGVQNADLVTPLIDMSNATNINLSFLHFYNWVNDDVATLSYSIDGGSNWVQIQQWTGVDTANPATFNQGIPALNGQSNVKIKWNYTGSWDWFWDVDDISITGTTTSLNAPQNLITTSVTSSEANLSWNSVSGATIYYIYRSTDPYSGFAQIGSSATISYQDTNVSAGNKYFYYITADNAKIK